MFLKHNRFNNIKNIIGPIATQIQKDLLSKTEASAYHCINGDDGGSLAGIQQLYEISPVVISLGISHAQEVPNTHLWVIKGIDSTPIRV